MRPLALVLRAGAVVVAVGFVFSLLVDGAPAPVARRRRRRRRPTVVDEEPTAVKRRARTPPAGVVTIAAVGDIVMGSTPNLPPDGGRSFFDSVETDLAGDVVLGNLEGTLSTGGGSKCGAGSTNCYAFHTPPSYAAWLRKAGFTVLNLANNHAFDYGPSGQAQTLAALQKQRLAPTGRPGEIAYQQVGEIKVAVVGFAPVPVGAAADRTSLPRGASSGKRRPMPTSSSSPCTPAPRAPTTARTTRHRDVPGRESRQRRRVLPRGRRCGRDLVVGTGPTCCAGWSGTAAT